MGQALTNGLLPSEGCCAPCAANTLGSSAPCGNTCPSVGSSCSVSGARPSRRRAPLPGEEWLFDGLPQKLAAALRETGQWEALRCRPWLSSAAQHGFVRKLQDCQPWQLAQRHEEAEREAEAVAEAKFARPVVAPWEALEGDGFLPAGQLFRLSEIHSRRLAQLRFLGVQSLLKGKVAAVLLAGGASWRLGAGAPPSCCAPRQLRLPSGKSLLRLHCERLRRLAALCAASIHASRRSPSEVVAAEETASRQAPRCSIPLFVMTSPLTHERVVRHFEDNEHFGLKKNDVIFFQQRADPALDAGGRLLPQSLGGDFARSPGGPGRVLRALEESGALEQLLDRGVESLHVMGTENLLGRICDPVFLGFCSKLNVDCACKVADRAQPREDVELTCLRWAPVSEEAEREEAACGLPPSLAPPKLLHKLDPITGELAYHGSINSFFLSVAYIQQVKDRPVREHRVLRPVPYLDFYTVPGSETERKTGGLVQAVPSNEADDEEQFQEGIKPDRNIPSCRKVKVPRPGLTVRATVGCVTDHSAGQEGLRCFPRVPDPAKGRGLELRSWPSETRPQAPGSVSEQLQLLEAAAEVRALCAGPQQDPGAGQHKEAKSEPWKNEEEAWRCDVALDPLRGRAVPCPETAAKGPLGLESSLLGRAQGEELAQVMPSSNTWCLSFSRLACSLVVPRKPNAFVLESSILDFFAFTESAAMLHVPRASEFAPVCEAEGCHSAAAARSALHQLHCGWLAAAGARLGDFGGLAVAGEEGVLEISPLLSYEGEGLEPLYAGTLILRPRHVASPCEEEAKEMRSKAPEAEKAERRGKECLDLGAVLDTRPFYLQEYPDRRVMSPSLEPRFPHAPSEGVGRPGTVGGLPPRGDAGELLLDADEPSAGVETDSLSGQNGFLM